MEWLSLPSTIQPGRARPSSIRTWWQMPRPTSKRRTPVCAAYSRASFCACATLTVLAGATWSITMLTRSGYLGVAPRSCCMRWMKLWAMESTTMT